MLVSTYIPTEMSPASPTIRKTQSKQEISDDALTHLQSQKDIWKGEIEKTNTYCNKFKYDINKKLEHKSICERNENKILYERIVLLEKENNCLKNKVVNQQLSLHVAEEFSSGLVDKNNDVTPKNTIPNDKPKSLHSLGSVH